MVSLFEDAELVSEAELSQIKTKTDEKWQQIIEQPREHRDIGTGALLAVMARLIVTIEHLRGALAESET